MFMGSPADRRALPIVSSSAMPDNAPSAFEILRQKALNSRFFTISLLLHVLIVTILGGTVLFKAYVEPPDFTGGEGGSFVEQSASVSPPQQQQQQQQPTFQVQTPTATSNAPSLSAITTIGPSQATFSLPSISTPTINPAATSVTQASAPSTPSFGEGMSVETAKGISNFTGGWATGGGGGPGSSLKSREFQFTAYLAKYSGGDWDSTVSVSNNKITRGSLPNLLYTITKWSNEKIKANPQAEPLNLADEKELMAKKPPFILFTGHMDFKLTDQEVANLQKYIRLGGCIWGDSSLPGENSRFDIAFRREMRRIVPDVDKDFEPLAPDHPVFNKGYYPEINSVPSGINFYAQKVMALKIYGEIAVIYTMNDYCDMWQIGITEDGQIDLSRDKNKKYVAINLELWNKRETYIRNIDDPKTLAATYKFGTNMVIHLLTRWEDKLRFVPKGL